ncbi:MAG: prolipoprotein diacylglyceryl transferase [Acidimicrobiia bacterium]|nr:prolipoprotein diacylglyceryl transferase [Acidimicrobiia bacterium]
MFWVASIPSPDTNGFDIGPLTVNFYGVAIALGVIAAIWLATRRFEARGGDPKTLERASIIAVVVGILGARTGYVITHFDELSFVDALRIWDGGLAFFGGLLAGGIAMIWVMRREGASIPDVADSVAPAVPLAQAIGRWGNYFNQELYGTPSDLPWAVEISEPNRIGLPLEYVEFETFHPTFLYESLLNLVVVGLILWIEKRFRPAPGSLFAVYLVLYGIVRFLMELLRTDVQNEFLGIRNNGWIALLVATGGVVAYVVMQRRARATS